MITTFHQTTAVILRAGEVYDHGEPVADWTQPLEIPLKRCVLQPALASEVLLSRDAVESRWTIWAPATTDLRATDRIRHSGDVYEVVGTPQIWSGPGALSHLQADLQRWEG